MKVGAFEVSGSYVGDCRDLLEQLPDGCVQTCVTSPPYYGLRDYGVAGQIGLEATPKLYVEEMVRVFEEVRRVLRDDGTLWLNLGDSYVTNPRVATGAASSTLTATANDGNGRSGLPHPDDATIDPKAKRRSHASSVNRGLATELKHKDLIGIPWMVAFALRDAGWWLRMDIVWSKPNPMPESVTDRPTKAHEYIFLLAKSERYFYDADAIAERATWGDHPRNGVSDRDDDQSPGQPKQSGISAVRRNGNKSYAHPSTLIGVDGIAPTQKNEQAPDRRRAGFNARWDQSEESGTAPETRNKRSVWTVPTKPYNEAHFAVFNPELITPCILAGSRPGDLVLDPFFGSGTTGKVAEDNGRLWLGFDLNPAYAELQKKRTAQRGLCFAASATKEG